MPISTFVSDDGTKYNYLNNLSTNPEAKLAFDDLQHINKNQAVVELVQAVEATLI